MSIRTSATITMVLLLACSTPGLGSSLVATTTPEFTIQQPSGKTTLLSSYRGKVVMVEFFFLRSAKCLELARTMNKLNEELGARGFQPIAIAFAAPQSEANGPLVGSIADSLKLTYPVGYSTKDNVDQYLERAPREVLRIPQVIIIDRNGVIREQTGVENPKLEDENFLRTLISGLLREPARANTARK